MQALQLPIDAKIIDAALHSVNPQLIPQTSRIKITTAVIIISISFCGLNEFFKLSAPNSPVVFDGVLDDMALLHYFEFPNA
ncbi:hypothetical protein [Xenorhabdus szentirmaii]|uniref:hypothetical protein n=1 Tax=Xenorhabdus szentirmaii TaxID=290112 RepID=UPI0004B41338|nr:MULTISPECIES: hypothetical protein [Xenorhabdus]MBD2780656.1 hypothetical protein [Xenorhabdus sp. 38]PHM34444.1 hypothetical protein Xsze_00868 [Xenorhabdus szentirmaii DSM 16338]PHM43173.1 hypothetical protein Xszus_02953 [Xenorhabdus szentirmaii]